MDTDVVGVEAQLAAYGSYLDERFDEGALAPAARPATRRRALVAAAAVLVPVAALAGALALWPEGRTTVLSRSPEPVVALVPPAPPEGMALYTAEERPITAAVPPYAVYGQAGAEPGDDAVIVQEAPPAGGESQRQDAAGHWVLEREVGGRSLSVWMRDAPDAEREALIDGIVLDGLRFDATSLPAGWVELWDTAEHAGVQATTYGFMGEASRFDVMTLRDAPDGALWGINATLHAEPVELWDGQRGYVDASDAENPFVWWREAPGLVVLVQHSGGDVPAALAFAESLQPATASRWADLADDIRVHQDERETATTSTTSIAGDIAVLVANGSGRSGVASELSVALGEDYDVRSPTNAREPVASSVVYFIPGFEAEAHQLASRLSPAVAVEPMPDPAPVEDVGDAVLVVVLAESVTYSS